MTGHPEVGLFGVNLTGNARPVLLKNYAGLPATRTERRLFAQVDFRREMRPIAFVDPGAFLDTNPENAANFCIACRSGGISVNCQRQISHKLWERGAALTSRLQSFETELLTQEKNLAGLATINRELIAKAETIDSSQRVVLDMDSTEIPVYGEQEQSSYNGHFESTCYHPLLMFNGEGDCVAAKLRPGNVHSAEDWEELLLPEVNRQQMLGKEVVFRADDAFAKPEIYEALEERGVKYAIRIPANDSLERTSRSC